MNVRNFRVKLNLSPLDFPQIMGLGQSSISYHSEPFLNNSKVLLKITTKYNLTDVSNNKEHEVLSVQATYDIPTNEIKIREDVYDFYKDGILTLKEAYQYAQTQMPALPSISIPYQPIENYKGEIDRVFNLLISQN